MSRNIKKSEEDIPVPPLLKSAALWGMPNSFAWILFFAAYDVVIWISQKINDVLIWTLW